MLKTDDNKLDALRSQLVTANPVSVGYRIMVKPLEARQGFDSAEAEKYSELADKGFEFKSKKEQERESHGSDVGVVVAMGPDAYKGKQFEDNQWGPWCEVGDVVVFPRYSGQRVELPPGSGDIFHIMTDDDITGKYEGLKYE